MWLGILEGKIMPFESLLRTMVIHYRMWEKKNTVGCNKDTETMKNTYKTDSRTTIAGQ